MPGSRASIRFAVQVAVLAVVVLNCIVLVSGSAASKPVDRFSTAEAAGGLIRATAWNAPVGSVNAASALTVSTPVANPPVVDAGVALKLNVTITGGSGGYNITWLGLPIGCASSNSSKLTCHPQNPVPTSMTYSVSVQVVDGAGSTVTSNATTVQVNERLSVSVGGTRNLGVVPWTMQYTASPQGGTAPFQIFWLFGDGTNGSGNPVNHTYSSVGTYTAYVFVNDSLGEFASARYQPVQVAPPITVTVSASPQSLDVGDSLVLQAVASGGFPPYDYAWSGLPPGCAAGNLATLSCSPTGSGKFTVSVLVTDQQEYRAGNTTEIGVGLPGLFSSDGVIGWVILVGGAAPLVVAAVWVRRSPRTRGR